MHDDPALVTGRLNTNDYVAARDSDIQKLEEMISNSGASAKKRAFQSLPRTERRRAASHDPKRVPRRKGLRKKAELENIKAKAKKQRVGERQSKKMETSLVPKKDYTTVNTMSSAADFSNTNLRYQNRQKDKLWLPTHVWHRKRAFMDLMAGMMVARAATQKQYRKTYRLGSHIDETGAMAWDTSYNSTFIAHHPDLKSFLEQLLPGSTSPIYFEGTKNWWGMLPEFGPVSLYWYTKSSVLFQCHPLLQEDLWKALLKLAGITLEDCKFSIGSIDVAGPWALRVLNRVLSGCTFRSNEARKSWDRECSTGISPSGSVHSLFISDPRLRSPKYSRVDPQTEPMGLLSQKSRQYSISAKQPQSVIDRMQGSSVSSQGESAVPVLLYGLESGRYRILMPRDWVLPFWLSIFRERHVLLGGIEEREHLAFERGLLSFPKDFPETPAGWALQLRIKEERESAFHRKPRSKRPNFKSEIGCPFMNADLTVLGTDTSSQYYHVKLISLSRGIPKEGARIYSVPTNSHNEGSDSMTKLKGFITSGNFSLANAKGMGLGIVTDANLKLCNFRNVGERTAHSAIVERVNRVSI